MLRLLKYLAALSLLATGSDSEVMDISTCQITFYGQKYDKIYVNFTGGSVTCCFNGYFHPGSNGDCLIVGTNAYRYDSVVGYSSSLPKLPATIQNAAECYILMFLAAPAHTINLNLFNYGTEATCSLYSRYYPNDFLGIDLQVGGQTIRHINRTKADLMSAMYYDISGCRHSGGVLAPGSQIVDPETCTNVTCNETAVLQNVTCGPMERCQSNHQCGLDIMCTVTGSTVIDVHGRATSVQDRCVYELMAPADTSDFTILAEFRERRRRDVSFLDRVLVKRPVSKVPTVLGQGGRVWVDGTSAALNSTPQLLNGVMLSKDRGGVTLQMSPSYSVSVHFDGNTAQIHVNGSGPVNLRGLCSGSSQLSERKLLQLSDAGCETQYNDTADATINCNATTERCDLLKGAPFTACNIDPEPYINACSYTLCKYPAVDGLKCQFMEAYARECRIRGNATMDGWRSAVSCAAGPQAFCQDRFCSAHEFCGEKTDGGETRCFCRAVFASQYGSAFGQSTVCKENSASVSLVGCLLEDVGIDSSALHLKDPSCRGRMDNQTHMVTFGFNSSSTCGAVVMANDSQLIYKNTIMSQNTSGGIVRNREVLIDFCCFYDQPLKSVSIQIQDSSVIQQIKHGAWNYNLTMKACLDSACTQPMEGRTSLQLNTKIWVELKADGLDKRIAAVVVDSCWATNDQWFNGTLRYDLIKNGCADPNDGTVKVEGNGQGASSYFSFNTFRFSGHTGDVYLHCKVHLCVTINKTCAPGCSQSRRRRRSASPKYEAGHSALLTLSWTN